MLNPLGRNWGPQVNWDSLGKAYAAIAIIWTVVLYSGIAWLVIHRKLPYLRMRNIPLVILGTSCLHVYLVKILLAYTTNGNFLCSAEFWIMSIYLPFGIALFQANMVQFLSVSLRQRGMLVEERRAVHRHPSGLRGIWSRWRQISSLHQGYVLIGVGMMLQIVVTAAVYGTNEKLQGNWGDIAKPAGQAKCRKGVEWIPSIFWQLFWSCLYGPYLVYMVRNVRDTHYWRLQTILCVVSGFPGTPLWIAAVFSPAFKRVNKYWVPPMWLAPGIFVMQAVTVFFPVYEYYVSSRLSKSTMAALREWEGRNTWESATLGSQSVRTGHNSLASKSAESQLSKNDKVFTMAALENMLATDPTPLLHFAATKDFTVENIIFLVAVRNWKKDWARSGRNTMFAKAVDIYACSVSEKLAEFPINIEGPIRSRLDAIFETAVGTIKARAADPFHEEMPFAVPGSPLSPMSSSIPGRLAESKESFEIIQSEDFDAAVFDAAERSIMYLVLTNTWRKYLTELRGSVSSLESLNRSR